MSENRDIPVSPQSFSVKRAQVEFHNFASLGEPERAMRIYREENQRRGAIIRNHLNFIGSMTPFLEIGANAGHTSYMLCNEFGAEGFALDISADALRHGIALQEAWGMTKAPVRIAGDGAHLPFQDGSLQFVMTHQTLSQFMDLDAILAEVTRVLAPGGVFLFSEEPMRRLLSLRLYRAPYEDTMKPWERRLHKSGLLGYVVQDVIGAHQEESFGIRQNHQLYLNDWNALVKRHFAEHEYDLFIPERGWGERWMKSLAVRLDPYGSTWRAARLLGGTLAAVCRKAGSPGTPRPMARFEELLRCPDCDSDLRLRADKSLECAQCGYSAAKEDEVYNLLPSSERRELYPGDRDDAIDFSLPGHERRLMEGWYELEGSYGNRYRWIGSRATALLVRTSPGPLQLRMRGFAQESIFAAGRPSIEARVNGTRVRIWTLDRTGLFILEAEVPDASKYELEILASPEWSAPGDCRKLTINLSMIRLVPVEKK
ncbi:MAG: class I SAM-dependent methyltransferase [Bryobacteraceae bacterium]|nr:class I SAM-dependent methyltransferase [Bryobacteraceae bacterium]